VTQGIPVHGHVNAGMGTRMANTGTITE